MAFPSNVKIPKAVEHRTMLNLSCDHVTTTDWFKNKCTYSRVLVPDQSIDVNVSQTIRLAPLTKPFFGSCNVVHRAFWVPFRTIMEGFNEFITDSPYAGSDGTQVLISHVPIIKASTIWNLVKDNSTSSTTLAIGDFTQGSTKYKLTATGRYFVDILRCLGYQVMPIIDDAHDISYSALPLLALFKIYDDWYRLTQFVPNQAIPLLYKGVDKEITYNNLRFIVSSIMNCPYANDYFTASWTNPSSPAASLSSTFTLHDVSTSGVPASNSSTVINLHNPANGGNTPTIVNSQAADNAPGYISTYILDALQSLSDYLKRHQLVGYRSIDRFRARFGGAPSDAALNRSTYLGKGVSSVSITDVTSQSSTSGAELGDYSGFGINKDGSAGHFRFSNDGKDYGIFMVVTNVEPAHISYCNGIHRHLLDTTKLDFFTPEFDGLGCQAIAKCEVKADYDNSANVPSDLQNVWSWIPRYAHMKCSQDLLTGDFRNMFRDTMKPWHMFRWFDTMPTFNANFCTGDPSEFNHVFNDDNTDKYDHFFAYFHFDVKSSAPMSPLFENYHFDEAGREIEQKVGGTKLT